MQIVPKIVPKNFFTAYLGSFFAKNQTKYLLKTMNQPDVLPPMLVVLGPTASGKTRLAVQLARCLDGEIVSADSRQVYRGMDVGTGKDLNEYSFDNQTIKHHLIDIIEAGESYNVSRYQQDCNAALLDITNQGKRPILCGGTGFYIEAILKNHQFTMVPINADLRQELAEKTDAELLRMFEQNPSEYTPLADVSTRKRRIRAIEINFFLNNPSIQHQKSVDWLPCFPVIIGLDLPVEMRRARITQRLRQRLQNGLIEEVEALLKSGVSAEQLIFYGLEYKYLTHYLQGYYNYDTLFERLNVAIHQFAKRQMTFFRKMERDGFAIHWLDAQRPTAELVAEILDGQLLRSGALLTTKI